MSEPHSAENAKEFKLLGVSWATQALDFSSFKENSILETVKYLASLSPFVIDALWLFYQLGGLLSGPSFTV